MNSRIIEPFIRFMGGFKTMMVLVVEVYEEDADKDDGGRG